MSPLSRAVPQWISVLFRRLPRLGLLPALCILAGAPAFALGTSVQDPSIPPPLLLPLSDGSTIQARLREVGLMPPRRVPAVLVFGGFENAAGVLDLVHPGTPTILASFDYPFEADRRWELPGVLRLAPEIKAMVHRTREGIRLLVRALAQDPRVDPRRIYVIGASFGSPFAVTAAADEEAVAGIAIIHGFGDIPLAARARLTQLWQPRLGRFAAIPAWLLARALWSYLAFPAPETSAHALRPRQRVLMITAAGDRLVPRQASDSLWSALRNSPSTDSRRVLVEGDHLQPGSDSRVPALLRQVEDWIANKLKMPNKASPSPWIAPCRWGDSCLKLRQIKADRNRSPTCLRELTSFEALASVLH